MKRLLVANRGEIAVRILQAARELSIHAVAIYSAGDTSHVAAANTAVPIPSASSFTDIDLLVDLCRRHSIDAVHPGYGFLSESAAFASALEAAGVTFVGPSASVLAATGDKLAARALAEEAGVPVLPALREPVDGGNDAVATLERFARDVGWPIMLKAVDGGGGRGIRLVRRAEELRGQVARALAESASRSVFAEKAAVDGVRHVEVQVLGDGHAVRHFWERECSIQRRYQKIVEIAPSTLRNNNNNNGKNLVSRIIEAALRMACRIGYRSLGTFEFLAVPATGDFYFMEINPRLQVEHTVTECVAGVDLVQLQLLVASGRSLAEITVEPSHEEPPPPSSSSSSLSVAGASRNGNGITSIQLRVTAEDVRRDFALSIGRVNNVVLPRGNGVRVDTHISQGTVVSADFDSLLAKVIVTAPTYEQAIGKGLRALTDMSIEGPTINSDLLAGILLSDAFQRAACDTQWLEKNLKTATERGAKYLKSQVKPSPSQSRTQPMTTTTTTTTMSNMSSQGGFMIKKGDAWNLSLSPIGGSSQNKTATYSQTLSVQKVTRNDLPRKLTAEFKSSSDGTAFALRLSQADSSSSATTVGSKTGGAGKRQADPNNADHLACPLAGQLVEMLVDEGDEVKEFDSVAIVRQMKMELEVRAHKKGIIMSVWDVDDGDNVESGMLVCEIVQGPRPKGKL